MNESEIMKEMAKHLKHLSPDDIKAASDSIKNMFGKMDNNTYNMLDTVFNNISEEAKKEDKSLDNNIERNANKVATDMIPIINESNINSLPDAVSIELNKMEQLNINDHSNKTECLDELA